MRVHTIAIITAVFGACRSTQPPTPVRPAPTTVQPSGAHYTVSSIPLPGATPDGIFLDYLGFDPVTGFVWVPAGPTGSVDVIDTTTRKLTRIEGFATKEMERNGKKRVVGPSSVTFGRGMAFVGNRGDSTICATDERTPTHGTCGPPLDSMPDGIAYVVATDEVWVTTPRDKSIRILDGKTLTQKMRLPFDGEPEGFAVDTQRHRFYTNLEDKDVTLAIDLSSHETVATWHPACGEEGPHGLRLAEAEGLLFVACSAKAEAMDVAHDGAIVGSIATGDGVDDLDYSSSTHRLYVAAARAATLTIANVAQNGALSLADTVPTKQGGRNGVVDAKGTVYVADGPTSEVLVVAAGDTAAAGQTPAEHRALMRQLREERETRVRDRGQIFAKIAVNHDFTGEYVVFRDQDVTAFLDLKDPQHPRYQPGHDEDEAPAGDPKLRAHILVVPNQPRETIGKTVASDITAEDLEATLKVMREAADIANRLRIKNAKIYVKSPARVGVGYLHVHIVGERDPNAPYPPAIK